jgi:ATP-binding cassette subfamily B protein
MSLAIQAILIPLRFGVFFPEADVQTQYGMLAHDSIQSIERGAAAGASQLRSGPRTAQDLPQTTLVKLLARLYEPTSGRILVDGAALGEYDVRSWQRRLAVIYQDYIRYELDAATNIGLGAPEHMHDREAIERACEWAGAHRPGPRPVRDGRRGVRARARRADRAARRPGRGRLLRPVP